MNPATGGGYLELLLRMFFYLALVCAVLWFGGRWVLPRLYRRRFGPDRAMGIIDQIVIGPGKSIAVVKVLEHFYLVGISDGGVRLMTELPRAEVESAYPRAGMATTRGADAAALSPESKQEWGKKE